MNLISEYQMNQIIQELHVYLKGGQSLSIPFAAEKADVLNPQVEAFIEVEGQLRLPGPARRSHPPPRYFRRRRGEPRAQGRKGG